MPFPRGDHHFRSALQQLVGELGEPVPQRAVRPVRVGLANGWRSIPPPLPGQPSLVLRGLPVGVQCRCTFYRQMMTLSDLVAHDVHGVREPQDPAVRVAHR